MLQMQILWDSMLPRAASLQTFRAMRLSNVAKAPNVCVLDVQDFSFFSTFIV